MNKIKSLIPLLLLIPIVPILFIYLTFSNSVDCNQLVIDTYELHSKIDITEVEYVNCYFDKKLNTRISVYNLKAPIDLNKFQLINSSSEEYLLGSNLLTAEEQPSESSKFLLSGERWGTKWTYVVDHDSNRLWAELNYEKS